ncbi:SDR family NAD(P)-dependent oxidoreductase [Microbacterium sp.]|uniref:SDR family NAD(P)-dependent oxidoreductase n=1 Tax=Microbacterium sp. TaxID=51671 RepID=UPI003F9C259B
MGEEGAVKRMRNAIIITGAGSGIGRAVALATPPEYGVVVLVGRRRSPLEEVARLIRETGGRARIEECDVREEAHVTALIARLGGVGLLPVRVVAMAAIDLGGSAHELDLSAWREVIDVNLTGTFLLTREVIKTLVERGEPGSVVLCSSPAAFAGFSAGGATAYAASKGGVSAMTRTLAVEYASAGVRVNAVVPGATETPLMWAGVSDADRTRMRTIVEGEIPLGRLASPEEAARPVLWLLSDEASYVTGSHLTCDGGILAKASISI